MSFLRQYAVCTNSVLACAAMPRFSIVVVDVPNMLVMPNAVIPVALFYVRDDTSETAGTVNSSGNLLSNDVGENLSVVSVNGSAGNVGISQVLTNGTAVTVETDGSYVVDPSGCNEIATEGIVDTIVCEVSNGVETLSTTLAITVFDATPDDYVSISIAGADAVPMVFEINGIRHYTQFDI